MTLFVARRSPLPLGCLLSWRRSRVGVEQLLALLIIHCYQRLAGSGAHRQRRLCALVTMAVKGTALKSEWVHLKGPFYLLNPLKNDIDMFARDAAVSLLIMPFFAYR